MAVLNPTNKNARQAERLRTVADAIESDHTKFSMSDTYHPACGSPSCIAGYTVAVLDPERYARLEGDPFDLIPVARVLLDLDAIEETDLFMPETEHVDFSAEPGDPFFITWEHAVRTLRHFAKTGEIDWTYTGRRKDAGQ